MDLLKLINDKIAFFEGDDIYQNLESIIQHIKISMEHLSKGRKGEDYFFNDAIYRTNQAFEGVLREANSLLNKSCSKKGNIKLHEIEEYLDSEQVLKERVLSQFRIYRRSWRNESTHNYMAYFSEQEAFLGIVNLCAFVHIMLDQMIEAVGYRDAKQTIVDSKLTRQVIDNDVQADIASLLTRLPNYLSKNLKVGTSMSLIRGHAILGAVQAILEKERSDLKLVIEPSFNLNNRTYRPDFLIGSGNDQVILEVKTTTYPDKYTLKGIDQLSSYLLVAGLSKGVLLITSSISNMIYKTEKIVKGEGDNQQIIFVVSPDNENA